MPSGFPKDILVHDCWPSHLNTAAAGYQICPAHLLTELNFFKEKYQCPWAAQFSQMIMQAIEPKKMIKHADYKKPIQQRAAIEALLDELIRQQISAHHTDVITFQRRIIKQGVPAHVSLPP